MKPVGTWGSVSRAEGAERDEIYITIMVSGSCLYSAAARRLY